MVISITAFCLMFLITTTRPNTVVNNSINSRVLTCIFIFIVSISVIFREYSPLSDTGLYVRRFIYLNNTELMDMFQNHSFDPLFSLLIWTISQTNSSPVLFLGVVWVIFLMAFLRFLAKILTPTQVLLVFFSYTMFYFFYSLSTNILRQGLATSLILIVLGYYLSNEEKWFKSMFILFCASLFHWSAIPFCVILLILKKIAIKTRTLLIIWVLSALAYITNLQHAILNPLLPYVPKFEHYQTLDNFYRGGVNRLDFLIFSFIWIIFMLFANKIFGWDSKYNKLLKVYIAFNSVFLLMGFIPFSDRIGIYSWILIPIIIWLPIFRLKKLKGIGISTTIIIFIIVGIATGVIDYYNFI